MKRKHPFNLSSTRGGYRENAGRKSGWNHRETCTIRIPKNFASQLVELARRLDNGELLDTDTESKLVDNTVAKSRLVTNTTGEKLSSQVPKELGIDIDTESELANDDPARKSLSVTKSISQQDLPITKELRIDIDTESELVDDDTVTKSESTKTNLLVRQAYPLEKEPVWKNDTESNSQEFDVVVEQAQVVRQIFDWVGKQRATIGEVCRRLNAAGHLTQTGKTNWDRTTVWGMLKNPAYKGVAAFGKTKIRSRRHQLRPIRGASPQPRRDYSTQTVDTNEWISVPVPAIVDEALFDAVQLQLQENQRRSRIGQRGARYLLQGLVVCKLCGYAYYGKAVSNKAAKGKPRDYAYYRCIGTDAYRFGGNRVCTNTQVRTDTLETAVWHEVCCLLKHPQRLEKEYQRRGTEPTSALIENQKTLLAQISKLRRGIARLIDSYAEGLIEKSEFEPRIQKMKQRVASLETQVKHLNDEATLQQELRLLIGRLEEFASKVNNSLDQLDWNTQREIIRLLVKRIEVDSENVNIVFRVGEVPEFPKFELESLQDCGRGTSATFG